MKELQRTELVYCQYHQHNVMLRNYSVLEILDSTFGVGKVAWYHHLRMCELPHEVMRYPSPLYYHFRPLLCYN